MCSTRFMESNRIVAARSARQVALWHAQRVRARQYREMTRIFAVVAQQRRSGVAYPATGRVKVDA